jgi:hypothetical protein
MKHARKMARKKGWAVISAWEIGARMEDVFFLVGGDSGAVFVVDNSLVDWRVHVIYSRLRSFVLWVLPASVLFWVESIVQSIAKKILTKGAISIVTSHLLSQKSIFFIAPVTKCYLLSAERLRMSHMNIDS